MIEVDLRHLAQDFRSPVPFSGGLDLARLAKERHVITDARTGLAELCALVLHRRLDKTRPERVSAAWNNTTLSQEQISYAALDAYTSLQVYRELMKVPAPGLLPSGPLLPSLPVLLYHTDNTRLIARGTISLHSSDKRYDEINLTKTRALITVQEVVVPGAVISTHHGRPLNSFGAVPFELVCLRSHLRTYAPQPSMPAATDPSPARPNPQLPLSHFHVTDPGISAESTTREPSEQASSPLESSTSADHGDEAGFADDLLDAGTSETFSSVGADMAAAGDAPFADSANIELSQFESDIGSEALGQETLGEAEDRWEKEYPIHSRVLKDAWHLFNQLYISRAHGLRVPFARALRDAIFIPDKGDKERIVRYLSTLNPPCDWDYALRTAPAWLWRHCKRIIPPPVTHGT